MRPAALRLDSFSSGPSDAAQLAAAMARDGAFHDGYEKGLAEGRELSLDALTGALADLRKDLSASLEREEALRREIRNALVPVLHAVVDLLGPRAEMERLRLALAQEMARLIEHAPGRVLTIRCPEDLHPDLADCLARAGLADARIEPPAAGQDLVELASGQGAITFDPSLVTAELKSIIDDIKTEE